MTTLTNLQVYVCVAVSHPPPLLPSSPFPYIHTYLHTFGHFFGPLLGDHFCSPHILVKFLCSLLFKLQLLLFRGPVEMWEGGWGKRRYGVWEEGMWRVGEEGGGREGVWGSEDRGVQKRVCVWTVNSTTWKCTHTSLASFHSPND